MVEGISSSRMTAPAAVTTLSLPAFGGGKVVLPIRPAYALFAVFKHIQVVPDARLENGIPLYKLTILDSLLEQMAALGAPHASRTGAATPEKIDALIGELSGRLRGYTPSYSSFPETGLVVNLVA